MKIFLSHNHNDKPIVEPIAIRLAEVFGEESIFYDSWSIIPGDSIIQRMSDALSDAEFMFVFFTKNSIDSSFVKMEWQNALIKSSSGKCKIIPVRGSSSDIPQILRDRLYIDLFGNGIDLTINQMVNVIQGLSAFTPKHMDFSNLYHTLDIQSDNILITISASHYVEPTLDFIILIDPYSEKGYGIGTMDISPMPSLGISLVHLVDSKYEKKQEAWRFLPRVNPIVPDDPLRITFRAMWGEKMKDAFVFHRNSEGYYRILPLKERGSTFGRPYADQYTALRRSSGDEFVLEMAQ